jgi:sulfite reductase beta subunit
MSFDPNNLMQDRITDIGPPKYDKFMPPMVKENFGKWKYHEILEPGILVHVSETGAELFTVRVGAARFIFIYIFV